MVGQSGGPFQGRPVWAGLQPKQLSMSPTLAFINSARLSYQPTALLAKPSSVMMLLFTLLALTCHSQEVLCNNISLTYLRSVGDYLLYGLFCAEKEKSS